MIGAMSGIASGLNGGLMTSPRKQGYAVLIQDLLAQFRVDENLEQVPEQLIAVYRTQSVELLKHLLLAFYVAGAQDAVHRYQEDGEPAVPLPKATHDLAFLLDSIDEIDGNESAVWSGSSDSVVNLNPLFDPENPRFPDTLVFMLPDAADDLPVAPIVYGADPGLISLYHLVKSVGDPLHFRRIADVWRFQPIPAPRVPFYGQVGAIVEKYYQIDMSAWTPEGASSVSIGIMPNED